MKKLLVFLLSALLLGACCNVQAQTTYPSQQKMVVDMSDLTPDQIAKIKAEQELEMLQKKLETYGNWVGVGGEVGEAVRESLLAVVDVADQFGDTDVGKFTLVMVAWKVMGESIVRILLGLLFFGVMLTFIYRVNRRLVFPRKVLVEKKGLFGLLGKKYESKDAILDDSDGWQVGFPLLSIVALGLSVWATWGIMFA